MHDERSPYGRSPYGPDDREPGESGGRAARRRAPDGRGGRQRSPLVVVGRTALALSSALVLLASGVSWAAYNWVSSGLNTSDALSAIGGKDAPKHLDNSVNLLLIGLDSRKDMNGNDLPREFVRDQLHAGSSDIGYYNTNTLILMHIPADGGKVTAFSVPRDDYVQTFNGDGSSQGHFKIKEAYGNAYTVAHDKFSAQGVKGADLESRSREAGREATLATVQNFLKVPIDHFAEVNLLGFYDIAKVLQPIEVCLKHPVKDRYSGADFPAGHQQLNPKQALAFVRQRHGLEGGDLDRTHRQQAFLSSVTHKLKSEGVFGDLGKLQGLFDVVKKDLVIDSKFDVLDFAQQATNLTGGNVVFHTLPIAGFGTRNRESVNLVDVPKIQSIVQSLIGGKAASPDASGGGAPSPSTKAAPATVDVLNGAGKAKPGAAGDELKALSALGYTAGHAGNATPRQRTTILYGAGAQEAAQQIAGRLSAAAPVSSASVPAGRVQVLLGADFTAPPATGAGTPPATSEKSTDSGAKDNAPAPVPSDAFAGDSVKEGGIPCVN
ncbi:LytR family transcriptional regulator [Streptomyces sp. CB02959]|uniref:LCP family protein n=1 Tax=Streptomyces sp. CB02959 TaxID=2020330 RepID=UPI000C27421C|nr:LCP family protein [Streptomyces sp. CB02959]PJN38239.1 LytR family transcriptional regulator [Streptomyces sp. CB02959]